MTEAKFWENKHGYYDPVLSEVIKNENKREREPRDKLINGVIKEIKQILNSKNLELVERIVIKDKVSKKIYR